MENILYIFNIFKKNSKIYSENNLGNRERSKTEYSLKDNNYQRMLHDEYKRKIESKKNKIGSFLRIRGSSF